jgi:tetratricopeptide (TPR) repeat protein
LQSGLLEGVMALVEPIIVVLGPRCGGTSAVAGVLHHLGVFMGPDFTWTYRELDQTWEDSRLSQLCRRAFNERSLQLQMDPGSFEAKLRSWADEHRDAARAAGRRPGAKDPLLCIAMEFIRDACGPVVPVVVDRPFEKIVASLNRLGWWKDEQERAESTAHLIAARDSALAGAATIRVDFEALRAAPAEVIRRLADQLGLEVTDAQIQAATASVVKPADVPREADPHTRLIDQLLPKVQHNPDDPQAVSMLAQIYFGAGDFTNARKWYARMIEIGGPDEDIFLAMLRVAQSMEMLGAPWLDAQDAYLRAWEFRPTRAEPLYGIARHYRAEKRYRLGYLFAERAAAIPLPENDVIVPDPDLYSWRAAFQQAVCATGIGKQAEAFTLSRRLLARSDIPDDDRQSIAGLRDLSVPAMLQAASSYPDALARKLIAGPNDAEVTVSLVAGPDPAITEATLNSFLHCCTDVSRVGRFLMIDVGLSAHDRTTLAARYRFVEFTDRAVGAQLREQIHGHYWLHLGQGWRFFAPENFITRLTAVLEAETHVFQVGINLADAVALTGTSAAERVVRRTPDAGRYLLTDVVASGPAMFDTTRLDHATAAGLQTASLDEVLCIKAV